MRLKRDPTTRDRVPLRSVLAVVVSVLIVTSTGATVLFAGTVQAQPSTTQGDVSAPAALDGGGTNVDLASPPLQTGANHPLETAERKSVRGSTDRNRDLGTVFADTVVPPDFSSETFLSGLTQPMGVAFLPDGRALVIEKPGKIDITDPTDGTKNTEVYLDISNKVNNGKEHGLLDITIDPNFEQNGYIYVYYSNSGDDKNRIARFTNQENGGGLESSAGPSSEYVVWKEHVASDTCCHQGAGLDFGPDGKLWLTPGDDFKGGAQSQDLTRSGGKIVRINKDGSFPDSNPYKNDGNSSTLGEIWSYGLRNPYRAEWDLQSDQPRFFIGNVGGNSPPDYEEVEIATLDDPKTNYGWPRCEATSRSNKVDGEEVPCDIAQTPPLYAYDHSVGNSITGGKVYHGNQFPDKYEGAYFFGDYAKDWIKYMTFDSNGEVADVVKFDNDATSVNSITVGPNGALYWTSVSQGDVHQISYVGNKAPSIDSASANPTSAPSAPQTVDFSVSASDPENDQLNYEWTFGDGSTGTGSSPSHEYQEAGVYTAYVKVSDGGHTLESEPIKITIGQAPTVNINSPSDGMTFRGGDEIDFSASASDEQDGELSGDSVTWAVNFTHNPEKGETHTHPILVDYSGTSGSFQIDRTGHDYRSDTGYTLTVTATDSDGLSTSKSVSIDPEKVDITFETNPEGLDYSVDGLPQTGTVTYDALIGFEHELKASTTQCLDRRKYEFQGWSDGGAQTHSYRVPESGATLTANYEDVGECSSPESGLVAHYEADQGVATSGGQVTGWADQSGQGNDLTAAGDPTIVTAPSGQPAIGFDGDGDKLERTGELNGFPSGNGDRTVVFATKYESTGYGGFAFGNNNGNEAFGTVVDQSGDLMVQAWGGSNDFSSGVAGTGEGWLIQSATLDSGTLKHYKDGTQIDTRTHAYDTNLQKLVMGAEIDSKPYLDMEVGGVYVYDRALSNAERTRVENQLKDTYIGDGTANQPPTASDDSATVDAGGSTTIDVLANDDDPEGNLDPASVTIDSGPSSGTATVNDDGTITYTNDGSAATADSFVYTVKDEQGAGDAATVSVSVGEGTNDGSSLPIKDGLVTHFAADQGITTAGGDVITSWADQSGRGNDLTASGNPLVKHDTLNGSQVVSLDGDGDLLQRTDTLNGLPAGDADRTVMYVVNYQSSPSFGGGVAYGAAGCSQTFGTIVHNDDLMVQGYCDDFGSGTSADVGPGNWMTQSAVLSSDQVTHYKNGTQIDQFTHAFATDPQNLVVGAEIDGNPQVDMEVAEIVVYDRSLSDSERQQVQQYFDGKYFQTASENQSPSASFTVSDSPMVGQPVTFDASASSDTDGSIASYAWEFGDGSTATGETATHTYAEGGQYVVNLTVTDDSGATNTTSRTVSTTTQEQNTLRVVGSGSYASYAFGVSGTINEEASTNLTGEDSVAADGTSAAGAVSGGSDEYVFTGSLNDLTVNGDATVYLNGEKVPPSEYSTQNILRIVGSGSPANYEFGVSGTINKDESSGLGPADSIAANGKSASGVVVVGTDTYVFTGDLEGLTVGGDATVYLNGKEIDSAQYGNTK